MIHINIRTVKEKSGSMSGKDLQTTFFCLKDEARQLSSLIRQAEESGIDPSYQRVALRIIEDFVGYGLEDVSKGERKGAETIAQELRQISREARSQIDLIIAGSVDPPPVPRFSTSNILIRDGHFNATRRWPDGTEDQLPVIFTGYGHFDQVRKDLPNFPDYGINIIQIEIGPSSTVKGADEKETERLEAIHETLDLAADNNVTVNLLISPHYFPRWALEKYPHLTKCEGGFIKFCIDAPEARSVIEEHIRTVITEVGEKPALHSICLSNEPVYRTCAEDGFTRIMWSTYLKEKFCGNIQDAKSRLQVEETSFDKFPIPDWEDVQPTPLFYEWCIFNHKRFAAWHRWMADIIHEISPELPVHAKIMPTILQRKNIANGVDPRLFCELSQINGNDCWCRYEHKPGEYAQYWIEQNMFYDMLRSSGRKPIFNSENHIIEDRETRKIPWQHVRTALWQGAIHGQCATTIWVWERTYDEKSDFAGSIMHRPLCVRAVGETSLDLMRFSEEVTALQGVEPAVGLLYSIPSIVYQKDYLPELRNAYEALNFTGRRISFLSGDQLESGVPNVLIVPNASHIERASSAGVRHFVKDGGKIILLGSHCLERDDHDIPLDLGLDKGRMTVLPSGIFPRKLRGILLNHLGSSSVYPDSEGEMAWGVEWLVTRLNDRYLLNAVNLLRQELTVRWIGANGETVAVKNLFSQVETRDGFTMKPLKPILAEITYT